MNVGVPISSTGAGRTQAFMFGLGDERADTIHVQPKRRDKRNRPVPARLDTALNKDVDVERTRETGKQEHEQRRRETMMSNEHEGLQSVNEVGNEVPEPRQRRYGANTRRGGRAQGPSTPKVEPARGGDRGRRECEKAVGAARLYGGRMRLSASGRRAPWQSQLEPCHPHCPGCRGTLFARSGSGWSHRGPRTPGEDEWMSPKVVLAESALSQCPLLRADASRVQG